MVPLDESRRVVVTGLGVVTTIGDDTTSFLDALVHGRSGITRWKNDLERPYSKIGGDMSAFDLAAHLDRVGASYSDEQKSAAKKLLRQTPLSGRLTACSALQAYHSAGLQGVEFEPDQMGHVLAGHNLNADYIVQNVRTYFDEDPEYIDPLFGLMCMDTDVLSVSSELLGIRGPSFTVGGACASGNMGVLAAFDVLRMGRADAMLVSGGALETDPVALQGWAMIEAISMESYNDAPERASRPFDLKREGFVPGQGSGAVILETLDHARARGASILAEVYSAASTSDACRLPKPNQEGQARSVRNALTQARVNVSEVDYINAHATSTSLGDAIEVAAIRTVLGEHALELAVNSTKSMIGHNLCAAGIIELVATILQMNHGVLHPTINQEEADPALGLDFVPNTAREAKIDVAMSNSFGFGGINSTVVVGKLR